MKKAPVLNEKQYKSLLNATKMPRYADRNRMMVVLSYGVGLRACEIAAITVGDVLYSENNVRDSNSCSTSDKGIEIAFSVSQRLRMKRNC